MRLTSKQAERAKVQVREYFASLPPDARRHLQALGAAGRFMAAGAVAFADLLAHLAVSVRRTGV
jgi:hypothetical protein